MEQLGGLDRMKIMDIASLTDEELIRSLKTLAGDERRDLADILKHLAEFESRSLAVRRGFPSLFDYCVRELRYAQGEAARRIRAARAADKYKMLYRMIERGTLSLTTVALLEPHLKWDNYRRLIRLAAGASTREVEALVATLAPAQAPPERIRFVSGVPAPAAPSADPPDDLFAPPPAPPPAPLPAPLPAPPAAPSAPPATDASAAAPAPRRVHFSFTADESVLRDYERVRELSRRRWPTGRVEDVFAGAMRALLEKIDPERRAARARRLSLMRRRVRRVPAAIADAVWRRDGGRCVFRAPDGRFCASRENLELDHVVPFALGGRSDDPANLRLLCRAHNALEARRVFGDEAIDAAIARGRGP